MIRIGVVLLPFILFPAVAYAQSSGSAPTIVALQWLAGEWQQHIHTGIAYEKWAVVNDALMVGSSGSVNGKDTVEEETIRLYSTPDTTWYIPTVHKQNGGLPVPFRLVYAGTDSFAFAAPAHDFPQYISYARNGDKQLTARIWGTVNGKRREIKFPMQKVK